MRGWRGGALWIVTGQYPAQRREQRRQRRAQTLGVKRDGRGARQRREPLREHAAVNAGQQQRNHPIVIGAAAFGVLGDFDFTAQPGRIAGVQADHHQHLPGLLDCPAHFGDRPVSATGIARVAPDAQSTGFQRQTQIPGKGGIDRSVADKQGGFGHRSIPGAVWGVMRSAG